MKAFVTGGSGFVGGQLIRYLRERGWTVAALARSDRAEARVRAAGAEPVRGDLADRAALEAGLRGCQVAFHAAAEVHLFGPREQFWRNNVEGTQSLLDAARAAGVRRVVHVSTEAVLAGGPQMINADESWPLPKHPLGLYPETKGEAERRVLAANRDGLETVIVRPRFIWGAGDTTVLERIAQAMRDGKFAWFGGGRHLTSTCHVRNVCEGALAAAERGRPGGVYFLTDGAPVEFRAFITQLVATRGVTPGDRSIPRWLAYAVGATLEAIWRLFRLRSEPVMVRTTVCLIGAEVTVRDDLARRELGYRGVVSREEGLAELRSPAASASR